MPKKHVWLKKALIALIYLAVWEAASLLVGRELLLPAPLATVRRLFELLAKGESWAYAGLSLLRIMSGYLLGVLAGVLLAVLTARSRFAESLLSPLRGVVKATPVTSFILLALLWLNSSLVPLFISFLMVLPMVWADTADAILHTDPRLIEMGRVFGLSRAKIVRKIYVPSVLPQFLAACTTSLGFAWKSGVAAEIIALPLRSIGYQLYEAKLRIETLDLFAWTLLVILMSMGLEWLLVRGMRRIRRD
ncbi:putative aliphatic sulfonates transport permease protein SsuC [bioreactor metagenome]|uniref:Putative aliphatic sulfonates transport permease protein SsuC n=1 Tax=bioreactor metagenome TaxID=1076179 RepID=A0A644YQK2_9ZZZZ